jgi:LPS O-antigen subunit length determinant protein (WzzB/FepE family)
LLAWPRPTTRIVIDNPVYQSAITDRDKLERELVGLEATVKHAEELHKRYDDTLKKLVTLEPEFSALRDTLVRAQENKVHVQGLWEAVQKKKLLGLGKFSVLDDVQAASLPLEKEGPNRGKLLIGGLFVGLFLGLGLVVLRALPDRTVRTREDLDGIEGLSVIGIVPRLDRTNLRRHVAMREQGW